ncbi:MAG: glycosyl transferase family 4 [Rhodanobacter sp.]|jgi:UDP-N-acetylmuramyl pentapeptide phosphotransferase/UDP-N-acetylglucosamine-1-phosphate transferase|nr:glycosyl transferase family 4 [Rhodanobacter sp.]
MWVAIGWVLTALLIALVLVRTAIGYAYRRGMLDQPGQRRSHIVPTPRGGGIGVVLATLLCVPGALWCSPHGWPGSVVLGLAGALVLVAAAGWWDDHRPLPVLPRLGIQILGVVWFSLGLLSGDLSLWWLPLLLVAGVWSINLHNFMDGIDGLLAQQTIFVASGLTLLAWMEEQPELAIATASLAAATLGFWWYNRTPARIFMGDVGSGSIGLLIFAFSAMLWRLDHGLAAAALILSSSFLVDAGLTLLTRMWRGRRWHAAHREHLYQWLVRSGGTHAGTDAVYLAWNLLIAAPGAWLAASHQQAALPTTIVVYLIAAAAWLTLKRRCLRRKLPGGGHVAA